MQRFVGMVLIAASVLVGCGSGCARAQLRDKKAEVKVLEQRVDSLEKDLRSTQSELERVKIERDQARAEAASLKK